MTDDWERHTLLAGSRLLIFRPSTPVLEQPDESRKGSVMTAAVVACAWVLGSFLVGLFLGACLSLGKRDQTDDVDATRDSRHASEVVRKAADL